VSVIGYHADPDAIIVRTTGGRLKLQVITPEIMRVVYTGRDRFGAAENLMTLPGLPATAPAVTETATGLLLSTGRLRLAIDRRCGAFTWTDAAGNPLAREPHDGAETKSLTDVEVLRPLSAQHSTVTTSHGADGVRARADGAERVVDRIAYSTRLRLEFSEGEAVYGLGQHEEGILNYRGHQQYLYQQNLKIAAPVLVSTRGYGVFWNTASFATFHDDQHGTYFWTEVDDELDYYFMIGPELDQIVGHLRTLTGQVPMLPRWALGYFQSKERYTSQEELVEVVREHRRRGIPIDCVVQDWMSWPDDLWGQKSFDPARYPDPERLCGDLHALHARLMVSIWPTMHNGGPDQVQLRKLGYLLADGATYNAFLSEAGEQYWQQTNDGYFRYGVDAWWADCTEPFERDWSGAAKPEPWQRAIINTDEAKKYLDPEYINAYSLPHTRALFEGQRASDPSKRVTVLTRSSYPGQQRYGAISWSGDTTATWATLRRQIADGLNYCVTGNPRWSSDIGGFFAGRNEQWFWRGDYPDGCADLGYRELYVRWLQFGALLPNFRAHGTDTPREPWRFGDVGDATYDTIVAFIRLRYRLLPYLYTLHGWETQRQYTTMRLLAFDFRHDPAVYDIDDQFMVGPALMVCPVTEAMYYGTGSTPLPDGPRSRSVYLPAGGDWYDFWTAGRHPGGQVIETAAPLNTMPIFVRAGSILPLGPAAEHAEQSPDTTLEVRVYPGTDGTFDLYEDAGDGYGYEQGEFTFTPLRWSDAERRLTIEARTGRFPGMAARREFTVILAGEHAGHGARQPTGRTPTLAYAGMQATLDLG
jgi:alpha-D-xyloside xylohydrolase